MSHRLDIELTSARDDGSWTWRAAGARQPKGVLDGSLLYAGAKAGDVVRAEADVEIDGITVTLVYPPKERRDETSDRLQIIGPPRREEPLVKYAPGAESRTGQRRPRPERSGGEGPRPGRGDRRERPPRPDGGEHRDQRVPHADHGDRPPRRDRPSGPDRPDRGERPARTDRPDRPARTDRPDRGERSARTDERRSPRPARPDDSRTPRPPARPQPERPRQRRLQPGRTRRDAVLAELPEEHRPIAEEVLRGGLPAVRRAIEAENTKAASAGRSPVAADALLAIAEELLPKLRYADWLDRAEAAILDLDTVAVRDLRSVVTSADTVVRDETGRALVGQLRAALDKRTNAIRDEWVREIGELVEAGRLVRALRISGRPPEPGMRFDAELATRLSDAAGTALAADTPPDRWVALLDAVALSPVRRTVHPGGLPAGAGDDVLQAARNAAGRVPALAKLLGIGIPPPPGPPRRPLRPPPPPPPTAPSDRAEVGRPAPVVPEPEQSESSPLVSEPTRSERAGE
jgi:hypothetical protein